MTSLWGWGLNGFWELGIGDDSPRTRPTRILAPALATAFTTDQRSFGIGTDGALWAWGDEVGGRLGLSDTDAHAATPLENGNLSGYVTAAVVSGRDYSYARVKLDRSWEWVWWGRGRNTFNGSIGEDERLPFTVPTLFPFGDVSTIAAFWDESIGITDDGKVFAWRPNDGDASVYEVYGFLSPVVQVETHGGDAAALDDQGRVYFWKLEGRWAEALLPYSDQLSPAYSRIASYVNLTRQPRRTFTDAPGKFTSISLTSGGVLLAIHESGDVWAAGPNKPWALSGTGESEWVQGSILSGLPPVVQVAGCRGRGFALDDAGCVWTWGTALTPLVFDDAPAPVVVPELRDVVHISAHSANFLALCAD